MKPRHLIAIARCRCGERFTKLTQAGAWYWCLFCDAHISGCNYKGTPGDCKCQRIAG